MAPETSFDGEKAYKHLTKLAVDIGSRNSGSENERKAAKYLEQEFKKLGLKTELQAFKVQTGTVTEQSLELIELTPVSIECKALPLAGPTPKGGVEGELVVVESVVEEYVSSKIAGKIVITTGYYRKGIDLLAKYRPLGVINIGRPGRDVLGHGWGISALREKYGPIPTVNIRYEDGLKLLDKEGSKIRLVVEVNEETVEAYNVIGELEGNEKPDEIVLIGGHYDTVPDVPGASDNAAGTAIVMELARVFKEKGTKRTMRFIGWACEEIGCKGSENDVKRLKSGLREDDSEFDRIKLVVNIDVQGARLGSNTSAMLGPPELEASVKLLAKEKGVLFNIGRGGGGIRGGVYSSDGTSYSSLGIPSVNFIRGGTKGIHSIFDTVEWLHPDGLKQQGAFIEEFLTRYVAESHVFPFEKTIPEKQKQAIKKYYKEKMQKPPGEPSVPLIASTRL